MENKRIPVPKKLARREENPATGYRSDTASRVLVLCLGFALGDVRGNGIHQGGRKAVVRLQPEFL